MLRTHDEESDIVLENNTVFAMSTDIGHVNPHDNVGDGIHASLDPAVDLTIENNLIFNCEGNGIYIPYMGIIINNTVAHVGNTCLLFEWDFSAGTHYFINNIFYDYEEYGVYAEGFNVSLDYTTIYSSVVGANSSNNYVSLGDSVLFDNPCFALEDSDASEPGTFNYQLLWKSSCLHAGVDSTQYENPDSDNTRNNLGAFGGPDAAPYYVAVKGYVSNDYPFDSQDSPFKVFDDIQVQQGDTLDIDTSMVFEMYPDTEFLIAGELNVGESTDSDIVNFKEAESGQGWDGILIYNNSEVSLTTELYHVLIEDADIGIELIGENLDMHLSEVKSCSLGVKITGATTSTIDSCKVQLCDVEGIHFNNSTPYFRKNTLKDNDYNGLKLITYSECTLGTEDSTAHGNLFYSNGDGANTDYKGAEIYLDKFSSIEIADCYNDFVDDRTGYNDILIYFDDSAGPIDGTNNYFEGDSQQDSKDWFSPRAFVENDDYWSTSRNRTADVDYFSQATLAENQGNFEDAIEYYYLSFINEDNSTAFSYWIRVRIKNGDSIEDILEDVNEYVEDETLGMVAFWKRINLQNMLAEFETSIIQLDDYISNATTEEDSLIGLLCQLDTYFQMALANGNGPGKNFNSPTINRDDPLYISQVGSYEESVPYSINDYHAKCADLNSKITASNGDGEITDNTLPETFELEKAYPNPFNPATTIGFKLPETSRITMTVFDVLGRKVATILDKEMAAGSHTTVWNGKDASGQLVASGIYFVTMNAESFTASQKLILMK